MNLRVFAAALVLLSLVGCGRMGGGVTGKYIAVAPNQSHLDKPELLNGQELEFLGSGRFVMRTFPKLEGRVESRGSQLTLIIKKAGEKSISDLKMPDGKTPQAVAPILLESLDGGAKLRPAAENKNPIQFSWVRAKG